MNDDNVWSSHQSVQKPEPKVLEQSESWTSPVRNGLEDDVWSTVDRSTLQASEETQIGSNTADLSEDEFGDFEDNIESSDVAGQTNKTIEQAVNEYIDDNFEGEAHGVEAYEVTEIPPLSIDSTRDVWTRLTTIKSRIVKYPGTNLEREVTTILTAWRTEQLTKTSWERPSTVHYSPSESLGAGLFGWGQPLSSEDQQKVVQHKRLSGSDFGSKAAVIVSRLHQEMMVPLYPQLLNRIIPSLKLQLWKISLLRASWTGRMITMTNLVILRKGWSLP